MTLSQNTANAPIGVRLSEICVVKFCGIEDGPELHLVVEEHLCRGELQSIITLVRENKRAIYAVLEGFC